MAGDDVNADRINTPKDTKVKIKGQSVKMTWRPGFGGDVTDAYREAQMGFDSECLRLSDKYTPKDTGTLVKSAIIHSEIGSGTLQWVTPYARKVYYSSRKVGSKTGALRGPHWGERMKADNLTHLKKVAKDGFGRNMF